MLCWEAVGLMAGKVSTFGISIPSVLDGVAWLDERTSSVALGLVVPTPTCASARKSPVKGKRQTMFELHSGIDTAKLTLKRAKVNAKDIKIYESAI
jgi:hypothetical protein